MDVNKQLTDYERVELTKKSYQELQLGEKVTIGEHLIGFVSETIYAKDGMRAFVITNPNEVTILFKGSYGLVKGNPTTWRDEWLKTNLPILIALLVNDKKIPSQLKTAATFLNRMLNRYHGARFYLYGHSLGAINLQYALANCKHPQAIQAAYLYEGTNIWLLLDQKQRHRANEMRSKIFNYVDIYDPVTLGITASHHLVGKLCYVDSEAMNPIKQHMWGGYQFDQNGKLKLKVIDAAFLQEAMSEHKLLTRSSDLASTLKRMGQSESFLQSAQTKLTQLHQKHPESKSITKLSKMVNKKLSKN